MDENSCEGETSKSAEDDPGVPKKVDQENAAQLQDLGVRIPLEDPKKKACVLNPRGSSIDTSGPSSNFTIPKNENIVTNVIVTATDVKPEEPETQLVPDATESEIEPEVPETKSESNRTESEEIVLAESNISPLKELTPVGSSSSPTEEPNVREPVESIDVESTEPCATEALVLPEYQERREIQSRVRQGPEVEEDVSSRRPSVGPPPSYSFVMKQKRKIKQPTLPEPAAITRPPPPTYSGTRGVLVPAEENRLERVSTFPSFAEPIWRSHSQPALCPRCGIIVLTSTHSHDSVATHMAALALCLFGCWPCCLLPYCMNVCKNTYHHCPICQAFLGLYTPW